MRTINISYMLFGSAHFWASLSLEKFIYGIINTPIVFYRFLFHAHYRDLNIWMDPNLSMGLPFVLVFFYFIVYILLCSLLVKRRYFKRLFFMLILLTSLYWLCWVFAFNPDVYLIFTKKNTAWRQESAHYFFNYLNVLDDLKGLIGIPAKNTTDIYSAIFNKTFIHVGIMSTFICVFYTIIIYKNERLPNLEKHWVRISAWNLLSFLLVTWIVICCSFFKCFIFIFLNVLINYFFSLVLRTKNFEKQNNYFFKQTHHLILNVCTGISLIAVDLATITEISVKWPSTSIPCFLTLWYVYVLRVITTVKFEESPNTTPLLWGLLIPYITMFTFLIILDSERIIAFWVLLLAIISYFYKNIAKTLSVLPTYATERERKYLMFTAAKKAINPIRLFGLQHFNDNVYTILSKTLTMLWVALALFSTISNNETNVFIYVLIGVLSLCPWFTYFASSLIREEIKSLSLLGWRGIFLAKYQFHHICKYNTLLFSLSIVFVTIFALSSLVSSSSCLSTKLLTGYSSVVLVFLTYILFERSMTAWLKTQTYYRRYKYTYWTDEFWKLLSPLLRDYVYWKPINPDNYEEERPYYMGMRFMYSTNIILWYLFGGTIVFVLIHNNAGPNLVEHALFWSLKLIFTVWFTWTLCRLFRFSWDKDGEAIHAYVQTMFLASTGWTIIYAVTGWVFLW